MLNYQRLCLDTDFGRLTDKVYHKRLQQMVAVLNNLIGRDEQDHIGRSIRFVQLLDQSLLDDQFHNIVIRAECRNLMFAMLLRGSLRPH